MSTTVTSYEIRFRAIGPMGKFTNARSANSPQEALERYAITKDAYPDAIFEIREITITTKYRDLTFDQLRQVAEEEKQRA